MNLFDSYVHPNAYQYVGRVLQSGQLSEGVEVKKFEESITRRFRLMSAVAVNSGTSALHLLLRAYGVGNGDEVIISPQTFIATGLAVLYVGAIPVFADIDKKTGNITAQTITSKITHKTRAVLLTHWGGLPCDLDEIRDLCRLYNILILEDSAHALGAIYKNQYIGEYNTDGGIFSFQAIKHLTTGDGGLIYLEKNVEFAKRLRWFGIDRNNDLADETGERQYNLSDVGYKYHMNDFSAALGCANLLGMEYVLGRRKVVVKEYNKLNPTWGVTFLNKPNDRQSADWLFTILVDDRPNFIKMMKSKNIPTSVVHVGIDRNDIFGGKDETLENQRYWDKCQISLPLHHNLTSEDIGGVCEAIKSGW